MKPSTFIKKNLYEALKEIAILSVKYGSAEGFVGLEKKKKTIDASRYI